MTKDESIRVDLLSGMTYSQIERKNHVNSKTITEIKREMILEGINLPVNKFSPNKRKTNKMLSKEERDRLIRADILAGRTYVQIINDYDISTKTLGKIREDMKSEGLVLPVSKNNRWNTVSVKKKKSEMKVYSPQIRTPEWTNSNLIQYKPKHKAPLVKDEYGTRCENCRHKVEQCRNCYSLDLIGRLPKAEEFNLIESKTAI